MAKKKIYPKRPDVDKMRLWNRGNEGGSQMSIRGEFWKDLNENARQIIDYVLIEGKPRERKRQTALGEDEFASMGTWIHLNEVALRMSSDRSSSEVVEEGEYVGCDIVGYGLFKGFQHQNRYMTSKNIYFAIESLLFTKELGLLPHTWALNALLEGLHKHVHDDPDPNMLASQLGVSARGSGKRSRFKEWQRNKEYELYVSLMHTLGGMFAITVTDAARVAKLVYDLDIDERTIINNFGRLISNSRFHAPSPFGAWSDEDVEDLLKELPEGARRIIRKYERI